MVVNLVLRSLLPVLLTALLSHSPALASDSKTDENFEGIAGVKTEYFSVQGETAAAIRQYLREHGAIGGDGARYDAYTEWHIYWNWPLRDNKPDIDFVRVTYSITVHLPKLEGTIHEEDPLRKSWEKYMVSLRKHEAGHVYQALYHRDRIEKALIEAANANPRLTAREANRIAHKIIRDARRTDEEYDLITAHGALQGAKWP